MKRPNCVTGCIVWLQSSQERELPAKVQTSSAKWGDMGIWNQRSSLKGLVPIWNDGEHREGVPKERLLRHGRAAGTWAMEEPCWHWQVDPGSHHHLGLWRADVNKPFTADRVFFLFHLWFYILQTQNCLGNRSGESRPDICLVLRGTTEGRYHQWCVWKTGKPGEMTRGGGGWLYKKLAYKERLLTYGWASTYGVRAGKQLWIKKDKREVVRVILMEKENGKRKERKALWKGQGRTEGSWGGWKEWMKWWCWEGLSKWKREAKMAYLRERKSFLFGTLQERNSCQSLKTQSREGNSEMHTMEIHEEMGKRQIFREMKMIFCLFWIGHLLLIPLSVLFPSIQDISSLLQVNQILTEAHMISVLRGTWRSQYMVPPFKNIFCCHMEMHLACIGITFADSFKDEL